MIVSAAWDPFGSLITTHLGKGGPGIAGGGFGSRAPKHQLAKQRAKHRQVATGEEVARILRALAMLEVLPGLGGATDGTRWAPRYGSSIVVTSERSLSIFISHELPERGEPSIHTSLASSRLEATGAGSGLAASGDGRVRGRSHREATSSSRVLSCSSLAARSSC